MATTVHDFPLFPLSLVALPGELVPLHIFEERYKAMVERCLSEPSEFGIVWLDDEGIRPTGCACEIAEVVDRAPDGRMNLVARGTRPFHIESRGDDRPYPVGTVTFLEDSEEAVDEAVAQAARSAFAALVREATDTEPDAEAIAGMGSYDLASTVEVGLEAKQGLLEVRSESARLRLVARLFRAAVRRMELQQDDQERARSNGRIRLSS